MAVARVALKTRDEHERPIHPDDPDDVAKDVLLAPFLECFVQAFGETVVGDGREVLIADAVICVRVEQLLGANQTQAVEQLRTDRVVARFAARQRQQRHADAVAPAEHRQHAAVFIVGMRRRVERARRRLQFHELLPETGGTFIYRERRRRGEKRGDGGRQDDPGGRETRR